MRTHVCYINGCPLPVPFSVGGSLTCGRSLPPPPTHPHTHTSSINFTHAQVEPHQGANFLHMPSVVFNRLGIDGRFAFVLFSGLIKANERACVCVWVCVSVSVKCGGFGPSSLSFSAVFSLSFSLTGSAGFFIQGTWSIWPFCLAINIDQHSSILSAPRQRPRVHCVCLPFLYHSPTNPQTALSLYEGILA